MTCRQIYTEFNLVYNTDSASAYKLIVNNFDLQQLAAIRQFINKYCTTQRKPSLADPPPSLQGMTICFRLDRGFVESIKKLLQAVEKRQFYDASLFRSVRLRIFIGLLNVWSNSNEFLIADFFSEVKV